MRNWIFALAVVLLVVGVSGCTNTGNVPSLPVEVDLSISRAPALNETAELKVTAKIKENYPFDINDTRIEISLSEGFDLVDGKNYWEGDMEKGDIVNFECNVKAVKLGIWKIFILMDYPGGSDQIYVWVKNDSAEVSDYIIYEDPDYVASRLDE